jgi:hypothetical protein
MKYVYSTLNLSLRFGDIVINGGAGVANKRTLITPLGVVTQVTDEQLEQLKREPAFQGHMKDGFITIDSVCLDADKMAKNMAKDEGASQETDATIEKKTKGQVKK